jgi:predicted RNase H-like HicB family nuclease
MVERALWQYTIVIRPDDNDTFVAHVPAIPGCHAWGRTSAEAQQELAHVFEMIREEYEEQGLELPPDREVVVAHAG